MGRDSLRASQVVGQPTCFNPRARVGRDTPRITRAAPCFGFNPRARVGRDTNRWAGRHGEEVSIHAPAWGATGIVSPDTQTQLVSIHAPAWGATFFEFIHKSIAHAFQSTRPRGARPITRNASKRTSCEFQSTRPRGARPASVNVAISVLRSFNPRARVGRDGTTYMIQLQKRLRFNPRARVGRDHMTLNYEQIKIYCTIRANPSLTYRCTALSH